jgi:hypothetical protein
MSAKRKKTAAVNCRSLFYITLHESYYSIILVHLQMTFHAVRFFPGTSYFNRMYKG